MKKRGRRIVGTNSKRKCNKKLYFWMAGLVLIVFLMAGFLNDTVDKIPKKEKNLGLFELYVDEDPKDYENLNEVHVANVFFENETFRLEILDFKLSEPYTPEMIARLEEYIQNTFDELKNKENLTITYENMEEGGALVMYGEEINKSDERYVYAIDSYLSGRFRTYYGGK